MIPQELLLATPEGLKSVTRDSESAVDLGAKAKGLLRLPEPWVPKFFILSPAFCASILRFAEDRCGLPEVMLQTLKAALLRADIGLSCDLLLRSNSSNETLSDRGRHKSIRVKNKDLEEQLLRFVPEYLSGEEPAAAGILVQRYIKPILLGHLSNERRVSEEYREALVETEDAKSGLIKSQSIAHKHWRHSRPAQIGALACTRTSDVLGALRELLNLAVSLRSRFIFEWVWDGKFIYVVQADLADESDTGIEPTRFLSSNHRTELANELYHFSSPDLGEGNSSVKLSNHILYQKLGFSLPQFFELKNEVTIKSILAGDLPVGLESDLEKLTQSPLIIRTSCSDPGVTLLPRSHQLTSQEAASKWLLEIFRKEVVRRELDPARLSLLAHHYIPALASAFSTGSPNERNVYIEALWGIPEGLYYFPCDAYLVDTKKPSARDLQEHDTSAFVFKSKKRFKSNFVAPEPDGRFCVHKTARPWDWKATISEPEILHKIAYYTRKLSAEVGENLKVMWFLEYLVGSEKHQLLPWYHDFEVAHWNDASNRTHPRSSRDEVVRIRTELDLLDLESRSPASQDGPALIQLVIRIDPQEDKIVRSESFAERLGVAASRLGAIVELSGGILSHVYFTLKRSGAKISVRSKPNFPERTARLNKLVRDKIPQVVADAGEQARVSRLSPEELKAALKIKLVEEAFEVRDADTDELASELADVLEVVYALIDTSGHSRRKIERLRQKKHSARGGFEEGVVLHETRADDQEDYQSYFEGQDSAGIGNILNIPRNTTLEDVRSGSFDTRRRQGSAEFIQRAVVSLSYPTWTVTSPRRLPLDETLGKCHVEWEIEGMRVSGGQLEITVRFRLGSRQLNLPFREE